MHKWPDPMSARPVTLIMIYDPMLVPRVATKDSSPHGFSVLSEAQELHHRSLDLEKVSWFPFCCCYFNFTNNHRIYFNNLVRNRNIC